MIGFGYGEQVGAHKVMLLHCIKLRIKCCNALIYFNVCGDTSAFPLQPHSLARCLGKVKLVPQEEAHEQHFHLVIEVGAVFQVPFQVETDSLDQLGQEGHHRLSQVKLFICGVSVLCFRVSLWHTYLGNDKDQGNSWTVISVHSYIVGFDCSFVAIQQEAVLTKFGSKIRAFLDTFFILCQYMYFKYEKK